MSASNISGGLFFVPADGSGSGDARYEGLPIDIVSQMATHLTGPNAGIGVMGYFNHFIRWDGPVGDAAAPGTGGWICTSVDGGGDAAESVDVLDSTQFGVLQIKSNNADNDNTQIQLNGSSFRYVVGKRLWFGIRCAPEDADDGELGFGLIIETDTDMVNTFPTDGIFFEKAETATKMDFHVRKNGTSTENTAIDSSAMTDTTMHEYAFMVDRLGAVHYYYDGTLIGTVAASDANLPDDEDLTLAIQVQTGTTATRYINVDYVYAFQER